MASALRMRSPNAHSPKGRDIQQSPKVVRVLQLCAPGDDYQGPEILSSPSAPEKRAFECAGLGFERKLSGLYSDHEEPAAVSPSPKKSSRSALEDLDDDDDDQTNLDDAFKKAKDKRKKKKGKDADDGDEDYYKILGLQVLRVDADDDDIKNAYRKMSLKYHPDRNVGEDAEIADEKFKQVQRAYENLSNPEKRRVFDSIVEDNHDDIPSGYETGDFFEVYAPVFKRYGRWSEKKPVPPLGAESDEIASVDSFYDFWFGFKSWRDYSFDDEHDPEDADCREEKRWMERENERGRRKYKKEESATIRKLVDLAIERDPRIKRHREFEQAEKERKRKEKYMSRQGAKLQEQARLDAVAADKVAAEAAAAQEHQSAKKQLQYLKKQLKMERSKLKKMAAGALELKPELTWELDMCIGAGDHPDVPMEQLQFLLFEWGQIEGDEALIDCIEHTAVATKESNKQAALDAKMGTAALIAKRKAAEEAAAAAAAIPWTAEEQRLLVKGVKKFPPGIAQRWGRITEFIGGNHPESEVIKACKNGINTGEKSDAAAFEEFMEIKNASCSSSKEKEKMDKMQADGSAVAWEGAKGALHDEALKVVEAPAAVSTSSAGSWTAEEQQGLEAALKKYPSSDKERWDKIAADLGKTRKEVVKRCKEIRDQVAQTAAPAAGASEAGADAEASCEWSVEEQSGLEAALKKYPSSDKERWDKIAADVGKTRKEVVKRCKEIREAMKK